MTITLKHYLINKNSVQIARGAKGPQCLNVEVQTKINPHKDKSNPSAQFILNIEVSSPEDNSISLSGEIECIFEFDVVPENYNGEASEKCSDIALAKLSEVFDKTLELMKYPMLNLYRNLKNNTSSQQ